MKYSINLPIKNETVKPLPFGGVRPDGEKIEVNNRYFVKNGKPWIPVMGEFHFSRWPAEEWETSLQKMRAGGIEIVATYIFWIHHEEEKGVWDFSGSKDLRKFIEVCKKLNFPLILRIGPWAHGECRNGGFPDWLQNDKTITARTNDEKYLALTQMLYSKIGEQAKGYLWQDNGPIVGIQLENEYGHCGGPNDISGMEHMAMLKKIAIDKGLVAPIYTATGWGGAVVVKDETLPVWGGYADAPWDQSITEMAPSENFLLSHSMNDETIGTDLKRENGHNFTYDVNAYPYLTAELGGGLQVTQHRRVVTTPLDIEALALCKLGSGANLLGYYMYHGGTNPNGKLSTLQESKDTGYPNDLPKKSYDFQAPIGESGELHDCYKNLKRLHMLLEQWGETIAPTKATIPNESASKADDLTSPRISVRHNAEQKSGFVFISNHLRKRVLATHSPLEISLNMGDRNIDLPILHIKNDDMKILPYNLKLGKSTLISTNAQPLTRLGERYFFFTDEKPIYNFETVAAKIVTLTPEQAKNAWKFADKLYICDSCLIKGEDGSIYAISSKPSIQALVYGEAGEPTEIELASVDENDTFASFVKTGEADGALEYELLIDYSAHEQENKLAEDLILDLDYLGDRAELYCGKTLIGDWFTTGLPYRTALKRLGFPTKLTVKIYPTQENIYFDIACESGCVLKKASVDKIRRIKLD